MHFYAHCVPYSPLESDVSAIKKKGLTALMPLNFLSFLSITPLSSKQTFKKGAQENITKENVRQLNKSLFPIRYFLAVLVH